MGQQNRYTDEQLITLLWLKVLDKLDEGTVEGLPFEEKYTMLDASELFDISENDFDKAVDFWVKEGIFETVDVDGETSISFTTIGKQLIDKLNEDSNIAELEKIVTKLTADTNKFRKYAKTLKAVMKFVIEHRDDIGSFILSIISGIIANKLV